MAGWNRRTRNLFDPVTAATALTAAGADEPPLGTRFAKMATWANNTTNAQVSSTGKKGASTNSTNAKGGLALWGQQGAYTLRIYSGIWLPSNIASLTGAQRHGICVLAQDDNAVLANARAVFCGLTVASGGGSRVWTIGLDSNNGLVSTDATIAATSLGAGASIARPFKVTVAGTVVTMVTPDGTISHDYAAQAGQLSDWFGVRAVSLVSITGQPLVEAFDAQVYDAAYTPPNDAYDRVKTLPGFAPIFEFAPVSEYVYVGGATPTYDTDAIYGCQCLLQTFNDNVPQRYDIPIPTIDLSTRCLALVGRVMAPDQYTYTTTTLANPVTLPQASIDLVNASTIITGANGGQFDIGATSVHFTGKTGNTLTGCTGGTGTFAAGTVVSQHDGKFTTPVAVTLDLAVSAAERTAGNYIQVKPLTQGEGSWQVATFLLTGDVGVEGRKFGTADASILTNIGYMRLSVTLTAALPWTVTNGAQYNGPQPAETPYAKWDVIGSFTKTVAPTITFTFDDSHDSDWTEVRAEMEKPRPGFPNGMRGTFHVIDTNTATAGFDTERQYQQLSASGHGIALHVHDKTNHESGSAGGAGPLGHLEVRSPGAPAADFAAQKVYLQALGIPGPFCWAYPYGESHPTILDAANAAGIVASRSTSAGGASATITGSGASADCTGFSMTAASTRFLTTPHGDVHRIPAMAFARDINTNDFLGHRIAERAIVEAAMQGGKLVMYSHQMYATGVPSSFSGSWNRDQFAEVLDLVSDIKTGGNISGRNGAAVHYAALDVVTLYEAITGAKVNRAVPEVCGAAM